MNPMERVPLSPKTYGLRPKLDEGPIPKVRKFSETSTENVGDLGFESIYQRPSGTPGKKT